MKVHERADGDKRSALVLRLTAFYSPMSPTTAPPCTSDETPDVAALKARDEYAFRCLFEQERDRIRRFVTKIIDDADEAQSIVQETFAEAYRQIDDFRGEAKVSTWLFSIARHLAYGHLRTDKRHNYLGHESIEFLQAGQDEGGASTTTQEAVETSERKDIVHAALQELPEHYRRVIQLRDLEEKSTAETAEALDLTEVNVRVRLHRARKQLREHLCERMEC